MSRLAKKPIILPAKTTVSLDGGVISVTGPQGTLTRPIHSEVSVALGEEGVLVTPAKTTRLARALVGTFAAHIRNMVTGVNEPYKKVLILEGVGYKVENKGKELVFSVGFSHQVIVPVPEGITATVEKNTMTFSGIDKDLVGQFSAEIRAIKPPEPYKGKGIRYSTEVIRRKQGKKAV
jgi:large subunit ribosomal protein L6